MNLKVLGYLLATLQILIAVWKFDWSNWNQIIISILLFLGGINIFLENPQSKLLIKIKWFIYITVFTLVIGLLTRLTIIT